MAAIAVAAAASHETDPVSAADYAGSGKPKLKVRVPGGQTVDSARADGVEFIFSTNIRARVSAKLKYNGAPAGRLRARKVGGGSEDAVNAKLSKAAKRQLKGADSATLKLIVKARNDRTAIKRRTVKLKG